MGGWRYSLVLHKDRHFLKMCVNFYSTFALSSRKRPLFSLYRILCGPQIRPDYFGEKDLLPCLESYPNFSTTQPVSGSNTHICRLPFVAMMCAKCVYWSWASFVHSNLKQHLVRTGDRCPNRCIIRDITQAVGCQLHSVQARVWPFQCSGTTCGIYGGQSDTANMVFLTHISPRVFWFYLSVSRATMAYSVYLLGCGHDGPGFEFKQRQETIPFKISSPTTGPTHHPAQWVEEAVFPGVKRHLNFATYLHLVWAE